MILKNKSRGREFDLNAKLKIFATENSHEHLVTYLTIYNFSISKPIVYSSLCMSATC